MQSESVPLNLTKNYGKAKELAAAIAAVMPQAVVRSGVIGGLQAEGRYNGWSLTLRAGWIKSRNRYQSSLARWQLNAKLPRESAMLKLCERRELGRHDHRLEVGDEKFKRQIYVEGAPAVVISSALNADLRARIMNLCDAAGTLDISIGGDSLAVDHLGWPADAATFKFELDIYTDLIKSLDEAASRLLPGISLATHPEVMNLKAYYRQREKTQSHLAIIVLGGFALLTVVSIVLALIYISER